MCGKIKRNYTCWRCSNVNRVKRKRSYCYSTKSLYPTSTQFPTPYETSIGIQTITVSSVRVSVRVFLRRGGCARGKGLALAQNHVTIPRLLPYIESQHPLTLSYIPFSLLTQYRSLGSGNSIFTPPILTWDNFWWSKCPFYT